jgi:o-succinylbenzoate---CoA ligase
VLDGRDAALVPLSPDDDGAVGALRVGEDIDDDVALVAVTSGTTGTAKGALLTAAALTASAAATHDRLGGPGTWLLALPPYHIAGVQVLVRSALAGTIPVELDVSGGFDTAELTTAARRMGPGRRYTSLVAAQLAKALTDPAAAGALAEMDAVLLGGGPASRRVLDAAAATGIPVVRTYGMSETAGGCVYDGVPLAGVRVRLVDGGRIAIGGATLAKGYRNPVDPDPFAEPGWFRTDDLGAIENTGGADVLTVLGRADDAISTGGLTVLPQPVEAALATHPAVSDCAVFGVADDRLGQRVVAAIVVSDGCEAPPLEVLRSHVARTLAGTAAPRELHVVDALPRRGIGKVDRRALARRFAGDQQAGRS